MTARCLSGQRSVSRCSGRRQTSPAHSPCCRRACIRCLYRLGTMATPRQGTVTAKDLFTLSDLEMLSVCVDMPPETVSMLSLPGSFFFSSFL